MFGTICNREEQRLARSGVYRANPVCYGCGKPAVWYHDYKPEDSFDKWNNWYTCDAHVKETRYQGKAERVVRLLDKPTQITFSAGVYVPTK
jgi:hypothetical protein